jgi:biotin synthase
MKHNRLKEILQKSFLEKEDIFMLLNTYGEEKELLFDYASMVKNQNVGNKVHLRGLIEYSNICKKDCYYCGIRSSNHYFCRYEVTSQEIAEACTFAVQNRLGSMVIQCGELQSDAFTSKILELIKIIKSRSNGKMRITLSCGEQRPEVYQKWFDTGAERYLLRIETSNEELYKKIHPDNQNHNYAKRIDALKALKEIGFQTGTGVMIGLPFQTNEDLADDIIFMRDIDIDMCGMGPFIEHENTPLYSIASTTALQAIDPHGKRSGLEVGANVIMPNITPVKYKSNYHLYKDKPGSGLSIEDELNYSVQTIEKANCIVAYEEPGDSLRFINR